MRESALAINEQYDRLTDRELTVLGLIAEGLSDQEIADRLVLSINTVKTHVKTILFKLHARRRTEAVAVAHNTGLLALLGDKESAPAGSGALPGPSSQQLRHNIPPALTSFVGRQNEINDLEAILIDDASPARLITLTGPPGSGKTRLALETARRIITHHPDAFRDSVLFIDLSTITDAERVLPAIAMTTLEDKAKEPFTAELLSKHLCARQMLVILDNFEQVVSAGKYLLRVLEEASLVRFLVTSRVSLRLYGEHEYPVMPLSLPVEDFGEANNLINVDSVQLLIARVKQRQPDFAPNRDDLHAIANLCIRLDGLPLTIELAAGQIARHSLSIVSTLGSDGQMLRTRHNDVPDRHQSLEAALSWSYALLEPHEQQLFGQLGVFSGGWTLDMAKQICLLPQDTDLKETLASLVEHNLVYLREHAGLIRYDMLLTLHDFAASHLDRDPDRDKVLHRHSEYFANLAEKARSDWFEGKQEAWIDWFRSEEANLQEVLTRIVGDDLLELPQEIRMQRLTLAARLLVALYYRWSNEGRLQECKQWCSNVLQYREQLAPDLVFRTLLHYGGSLSTSGDYQQAQSMYEEAMHLALVLEDDGFLSDIHQNMGVLAGRQADYDSAHYHFSQVVSMTRKSPAVEMRTTLAGALNNLSLIAKYRKDYEQSRSYLEEALAIDKAAGNTERVAARLHNLGTLAYTMGELEQASDYLRQALELDLQLNHMIGACISFYALAELALLQEKLEQSVRLMGIAEGLAQQYSFHPSKQEMEATQHVMEVAHQQLDSQEVDRLFDEGINLSLDRVNLRAHVE